MKRKITKEQVLAGTMAVIMPFVPVATAAAVLTGCPTETKENKPVEIKRTFTIVIAGFEEHPVTVKDTRNGANDKSLEALGVVSKLESGLQYSVQTGSQSIAAVLRKGMLIEVEKDPEYDYFEQYSGNRMGARLDYILSDDENFGLIMSIFISNMPDPYGKALPPVHDKGWQQYNRTKMQYDNRIASTKIHRQRLG